jgi:hypothetical protein
MEHDPEGDTVTDPDPDRPSPRLDAAELHALAMKLGAREARRVLTERNRSECERHAVEQDGGRDAA